MKYCKFSYFIRKGNIIWRNVICSFHRSINNSDQCSLFFAFYFLIKGKLEGIRVIQIWVNREKIPDKWGEIQGKLDLVRVIGVLLYTHLVHVITGIPSSRYECVPHKRVGVPLQTTVETLYVNHGIDLNGSVRLLLFGTAGCCCCCCCFFLCCLYFALWREWQGSHNNSQKNPTNYRIYSN